jgi:hypothetical protein
MVRSIYGLMVRLSIHDCILGGIHACDHRGRLCLKDSRLYMHTMILFLIRLKVPCYRLFILVELSEELFVLENGSVLSFLFFLLCCLLGNNLSSRNTRKIIKRPRLEPSVRNVQLPLNLLPHTVHFIN